MGQTARSVRLFRSNLSKMTKGLESVSSYALKVQDQSWVWESGRPNDVGVSPPQITVPVKDARPLALQFAPEGVASSGAAYAKWCILTAALSFQIKDPKAFLLRFATWWGDGAHPQHEMPSSDTGWNALFGEDDVRLEARKTIFTEILTSKTIHFISQGWENKVAMGREFNADDAISLAKLFPKSFADPFLNKANRAIWQFTTPYLQQGQALNVNVTPSTDPMLLNALCEVGFSECHALTKEKIQSKGFLRDEVMEQAVRSFLVLKEKEIDVCINGHSHEWRPVEVVSQTTDY